MKPFSQHLTTNTAQQESSSRKPDPPSITSLSTHTHPRTHSIAVGFAGYSLLKKLWSDGTLRLYRSRGHNQASSPADTKP